MKPPRAKIVQIGSAFDPTTPSKFAVACEKHKEWCYFYLSDFAFEMARDISTLIEVAAQCALGQCPQCLLERYKERTKVLDDDTSIPEGFEL